MEGFKTHFSEQGGQGPTQMGFQPVSRGRHGGSEGFELDISLRPVQIESWGGNLESVPVAAAAARQY